MDALMQQVQADWILTAASEDGVVQNGTCTFDRRITSVKSSQPVSNHATETITILTPGLVNTHAHLALFSRTPVECLPSETMGHWLLRVIELTRRFTLEQYQENTIKSAQVLLQSGCTTVNDISPDGSSLAILDRLGMRGVVSLEYFHADKSLNNDKLAAIETQFKSLQNKWQDHDRLQVGLSPHSPYNVSRLAYCDVINRCQPDMVHTHVGESWDEANWFKGNESAINALHQLVLGQTYRPDPGSLLLFLMSLLSQFNETRWVLAHGGVLSAEELKLLSNFKQLGFAHCPLSNAFLNNPKLDSLLAQELGLSVGFGTDSLLSNNKLDLRAEARDAVSHGLSPEAAFKLLTIGGAKVMGLEHQIGQLAPNYAADMVLWEAPLIKDVSPYTLLLHPATHAKSVWVNGQTLFLK